MERRQFLLLGGGGVTAISVVGVASIQSVGPFGHSPSLPDGMTVETESNFLEGLIKADTLSELEDMTPVTISSTTEADSILSDTDAVERFENKTDFSNSYLVAIMQWTCSNCELRLEKIERKSAGIHLTLGNVLPAEGANEGAKPSFILLRITDTNGGVPEKVTTESKEIDQLF
jgi:hypothetical protein